MHYAILVVGSDVYDILAPFDENMEVEHWVSKQELIENEKRYLDLYKNRYEEYLDDPEGFLEKNKGKQEHIDFVTKEVPKMINEWTDEDWYKRAIRYESPDDIREDGSVRSTYNPKSKYDWFQIGGRWSDLLKLKEGATSGEEGERSWTLEDKPKKEGFTDSALKKDIDWDAPEMQDFTLYGFVDESGEWHEREESFNFEERDGRLLDEWKEKFKKLLDAVDDNERITVVDCHI